MTNSYPIFTYWEGDRSALDSFRADWAAAGHNVHIFALEDVWPILAAALNPERLAMFDRIRIASCRSDLARLLLLLHNGGLYIDAHTGSGNQAKLAQLFAHLAAKELVVFDQAGEGRAEGDIYLLNGAMLARRHSALLGEIIESCFRNLETHWVRECQSANRVPYNIFALTGGWNMLNLLFDIGKKPYSLKTALSERVHLEVLHPSKGPPAFVWYQHYHYREPGQHWSERQKVEPLFERG
jgi:Glycosyltransferase sugar-binding region containing DXD motif